MPNTVPSEMPELPPNAIVNKGDLEMIFFGELPSVTRTANPLREGEWFVSAVSRGPSLVNLGIVASGFKRVADARMWLDQNSARLSDCMFDIDCIPTAADRVRLESAPDIFDVPVVVIRTRAAPLDDGAELPERWEYWTSRTEADARVACLRSAGGCAEVACCSLRRFSRSHEGQAERDDFLAVVNGHLDSIADGSVWRLPEFQQLQGQSPRPWCSEHLPGPYGLFVYTNAEVRSIENVAHSRSAVYGRRSDFGEYASREEAQLAGYALLAQDSRVFGFLSWPVHVPDSDPPFCYVARATKTDRRLIAGSRLSEIFEGTARRAAAKQARDALLTAWPDAAVFFASKRSRATGRTSARVPPGAYTEPK